MGFIAGARCGGADSITSRTLTEQTSPEGQIAVAISEKADCRKQNAVCTARETISYHLAEANSRK